MADERRYDARDYATPASIRSAHYDRLREGGVSAERAREIADAAVDKTLRKIDRGMGLDARASGGPTGSGAVHRPRLRVRFPWEPESAGIDL